MRAALAAALLFVLAACTSRVPTAVPHPAAAPAGFPAARYAQALARGEPVYRIDPERSQILVRVYRGGPLARLGHDHVVAGRDVRGYVLLPRAAAYAQADLYLSLASLAVDDPALRAQAGFDTRPSPQDIEATRRNMMSEVLDVARYPFAVLHVIPGVGAPPRLVLTAELTLHGVTRALPITAALEPTSAGGLAANGRFSLKQTDFGIEPYAVLGGALRVEDSIDIDFQLHAVRVAPDEKLLPPG